MNGIKQSITFWQSALRAVGQMPWPIEMNGGVKNA